MILDEKTIDDANKKTIDMILKGDPVLTDILPAAKVIPKMSKNMILHAGPPIEWSRMCQPQKNAVIGGILYEGLADTADQAVRLVERNEIRLAPCHEHDSVGGMTGVITGSMSVYVIKNRTYGNTAYSNHHEGWPTKALHWGNNDQEVLSHLRWLDSVLTPVLQAAIKGMGGLNVKKIISKALQMNDECHSRCTAGTALFVEEVAPYIVTAELDKNNAKEALDFLRRSEVFFLHIVMAAMKALVAPAKGIEHSTVVTTLARNGVEFGIRVSGLDDEWFTGPAGQIHGLYFPGFGLQDATPDMGDSAITEVVGLGGMSIAASPSIVLMKGGTIESMIEQTREMRRITATKNPFFTIPFLNFEGAPFGIDIRRVVESGITPYIDTAIAHKNGGLIGSGIARAPIECFEKALNAFKEKYGN